MTNPNIKIRSPFILSAALGLYAVYSVYNINISFKNTLSDYLLIFPLSFLSALYFLYPIIKITHITRHKNLMFTKSDWFILLVFSLTSLIPSSVATIDVIANSRTGVFLTAGVF